VSYACVACFAERKCLLSPRSCHLLLSQAFESCPTQLTAFESRFIFQQMGNLTENDAYANLALPSRLARMRPGRSCGRSRMLRGEYDIQRLHPRLHLARKADGRASCGQRVSKAGRPPGAFCYCITRIVVLYIACFVSEPTSRCRTAHHAICAF
jgi:hypothetical protein